MGQEAIDIARRLRTGQGLEQSFFYRELVVRRHAFPHRPVPDGCGHRVLFGHLLQDPAVDARSIGPDGAVDRCRVGASQRALGRDRPRAGLDMPVEHVGIIGMPHRVVRGILLGEQALAILLDRALRSAKSLQPRDFHRQARADRPFIDRMQFGRQHAQAALVFGIERLDRRFDLQDGAEALLTSSSFQTPRHTSEN